MTDNEIMKALECCRAETVLCPQCPLKDVGYTCEDKLTGYAFDLVNHQKAEINTLESERNNYKEWYLSLANEVNQYPCKTVVGNNSEKDYDNLIASIKAEAIKDFAERLKEKFGIYDCIVTVNNEDVYNLVKEMTEGKENA